VNVVAFAQRGRCKPIFLDLKNCVSFHKFDSGKEKAMGQYPRIEMEGQARGTVEDQAHTGKREEKRDFSKSSVTLETDRSTLILRAFKVLTLSSVFLLFFGCGHNESSEKLTSIEARLKEVEAKLARFEGEMEKIARLERQLSKLERSMAEMERSVASAIEARRISKEAMSQAKTGYHVVQRGEILTRIARRYGMSLNELCRLNKITPETIIRPGQKLLVTLGSE
jgi:hypothetical protein